MSCILATATVLVLGKENFPNFVFICSSLSSGQSGYDLSSPWKLDIKGMQLVWFFSEEEKEKNK